MFQGVQSNLHRRQWCLLQVMYLPGGYTCVGELCAFKSVCVHLVDLSPLPLVQPTASFFFLFLKFETKKLLNGCMTYDLPQYHLGTSTHAHYSLKLHDFRWLSRRRIPQRRQIKLSESIYIPVLPPDLQPCVTNIYYH